LAPIPYRKFIKMLKEEGCTIDDSGYPHIVEIFYNGQVISTFSVTHGRNTKGNEVKPAYVRQFAKNLKQAKENEASREIDS
jgi:hypothetical protein